jgi:hypothetical protein
MKNQGLFTQITACDRSVALHVDSVMSVGFSLANKPFRPPIPPNPQYFITSMAVHGDLCPCIF